MPTLKWYYDEEGLNRVLVRHSSVDEETLQAANLIAAIASVRLAVHHANNAKDPRPDSSVGVSRGRVDAFVNLDDPDGGAVPIALSLGLFAPFAFFGAGGPQPLARTKKEKNRKRRSKKLGKHYGKSK